MRREAEESWKSGTVRPGMFKDSYIDNYVQRKSEEWERSHPSPDKEEEVTSRIGNGNSGSGFSRFIEDMNKYSKSIYDILNEGVVNVRIVTSNVNQQRNTRTRRVVARRRRATVGNESDADGDGGDAGHPEDVADTQPIVDTSGPQQQSTPTFADALAFIRNGSLRQKIGSVASNVRSLFGANTAPTVNTGNNSSSVSDMDQQRVQMITTALQTSMQDGDGIEDSAKVRQLISKIDDPKLKQEMTKAAESVLTKENNDGKEPKQKSFLGKLLTGLGAKFLPKIKTALSFVLKPFTAIFSGIKGLISKYFTWVKKNLNQAKTGAGLIKKGVSGLFQVHKYNKAIKNGEDPGFELPEYFQDKGSFKETFKSAFGFGKDQAKEAGELFDAENKGKASDPATSEIKNTLKDGTGVFKDLKKLLEDQNTLLKNTLEKITNS
jgi:hypothetical protein